MIDGFISYSHEDASMCAQLKKHLAPLEHEGVARFWSDHAVMPGDPFADVIMENLARSKIALLLLSPDFFNSDFIRFCELPHIVARANKGDLVYVPILIKDVMWRALKPQGIAERLVLPPKKKPIQRFKPAGRGYAEVAETIANRVDLMRGAVL